MLCISGNPTQARIRLSTQIQWLSRRSWLCCRPGGKTVSSRAAPLKGLAQEEQLVARGTGRSVLPGGFLGSTRELLAHINVLVCASGHRITCSAQAM